MPSPTPGQINYQAYWAADPDAAHLQAVPCPWHRLKPEERAAWEAAAQAVRALRDTQEEYPTC